MDGLEQIPTQLQPLAGLVFAIVVAIGSALVYLRGRREGAPKPKVQEFYASGQLADMGPVKELVENTGLLIQQQVRANVAIERCAVAIESGFTDVRRYIVAKLAEIEDRDKEAEIERRARVMAEDLVREQEEARDERRRPARKPSA